MFGVYGSILLECNSSQSIWNLGLTKVLFRLIRDIGRPWSDQGIVSINSGHWCTLVGPRYCLDSGRLCTLVLFGFGTVVHVRGSSLLPLFRFRMVEIFS
jgi:hypothetical protein